MNLSQNRKAEVFKDLHARGLFIMPNAWDPGSARILAGAGYPALGTTSAGIAFAQGLPDHQAMDRDAMLERVKAIAASVDVPVSADLEAGYGIDPGLVAQTVGLAIHAGVVGCNIEDVSGKDSAPLLDAQLAADRIRAARQAADRSGLPFTLTARTDTFLTGHPRPLEEAILRANLYRQAGADCIFVPGIADRETIGALVGAVNGPLNVVMGLGQNSLTAAELKSLGVRRISTGGSLARACCGLIRRAAIEMKVEGTFTFSHDQIPHNDLCDFFADWEERARNDSA